MSDTLNENFTVTTDKSDYQPGDTAVFTASNVDEGATVNFLVAHVLAGGDGIYGTEDDLVLYDLTGTGLTWSVTDGSAEDADGALNGIVVTSWLVNTDAGGQAFQVSAIDAATGENSTANFTDATPVDPIPTFLTDGTLIAAGPTPSTGSGVINSFLRIQEDTTEQGVNTDGAVQFNTKSGAHTHHINLSDIPVVTVGGIQYRELRLDVNESGGGSDGLTMHEFQLWYASTANLSNFDPSGNGGKGNLPTGTLIWDMDSVANGGEPTKVELDDWNSGSGKGDYIFYIPETFFAGIAGNPFVYVYAAFGNPIHTEGGFEEFYVVSAPNPSVSITKTAAVPGDEDGIIDSAADDITYTITVSNTGNVALTGVLVSDKVESYASVALGTPASHPGSVTIVESGAGTHGDAVLDIGEVWTYTIVYNVLQADIDTSTDDDIDNTATVDTNQTAPVSASAVVPVTDDGGGGGTFSLEVTKTPDVASVDEAGDVITYTITIENTGTNALTGIIVSDPLLGGTLYLAADTNTNGLNDGTENWATNGDANDNGALDAGETWTYTATYTVQQQDLNDNGIDASGAADGDGDIDNTVSADANELTPQTASAFVNIVYNPELSIAKDAAVADGTADEAGDIINYTVVITNTGNIDLTGVVLKDTLENYTQVVLDTDGSTLTTADDAVLSGDTGADGILSVGEVWTYAYTHTLTQAELDSNGVDDDGTLDNVAAVDTNETNEQTDPASVALVYGPAMTIDKVFVNVTGGDGDAFADAVGDVLNYTVKITNTGNVTLTGITVTDPLTGQNVSGVTLAPGASNTYNTSYTLTQADLNKAGNAGADGDIDNTATADSNETNSVNDSAEVPLVYDPKLAIDKEFVNVTGGDGDALADAVGDVLNYTVKITNTGNVTLTGVTVTDPLTGQNISGVTLAPGASNTYNTSYTLTQADLNKAGNAEADGDIDNTATADSNETNSVNDSAEVPLVYDPKLAIDKEFVNVTGGDGDALADAVGDVLNYTVKITNTGNVTLTGVTVTDPLTGQNISGVTLAPGASNTYNTSYTLTQADLNKAGNAGADGDIDNTATADSNETNSVNDSAEVPLVYDPKLAIDKEFVNVTGGDGDALADAVGDVLNYTVKITNTGNVTLTGVTVTDPLTGQNISGVTLAPGASNTYNTSYTLTQADLNKAGNAGADGDIDNTATADSNETNSVNDSAEVPLVYDPKLAIDKVFVNVTGGDGDAFADAVGDVLNYTVKITNTGNVTLTGVTVVDPLTGQNISGVTLAPGASQTYNTSYTLTLADLSGAGNAGSDHDIDNTATADLNETNPVSDTETVPLGGPGLSITKMSNIASKGAHADKVGDVITYKIVVDNTGTTDLTHVVVKDQVEGHPLVTFDINHSTVSTADDAVLTGDVGNDGILGVNETWTYTYKYTLTANDLFQLGDDNRLCNTATAYSDQTSPESTKVVTDLGPGVKTYGFWATSSIRKFWDGIAGNETHSQTVADGHPISDITRPPYANDDATPANIGKVLDPVDGIYKTGLLVGDWNLNGETDFGEQTIYYSPAEAVAIMTALGTVVNQDARYALDRQLIASWLNYQAGNPVFDLNEGGVGDKVDAEDVINWGIAWIVARTGNEGGSPAGDGSLTFNAAALKILASSPFWTTGIDADGVPGVSGVSPVPMFNPAGDIPGGAALTSLLNEYNDHGTILGVHIALM